MVGGGGVMLVYINLFFIVSLNKFPPKLRDKDKLPIFHVHPRIVQFYLLGLIGYLSHEKLSKQGSQ